VVVQRLSAEGAGAVPEPSFERVVDAPHDLLPVDELDENDGFGYRVE
jgi:hypothetical protein